VNRIVKISDAGRGSKNDPAIFALALVVTHGDAPALSNESLGESWGDSGIVIFRDGSSGSRAASNRKLS
jgi:hypothetical protein